MYMRSIPMVVERAYSGDPLLNVAKMQDFATACADNFSAVQMEFGKIQRQADDTAKLNSKLMQFMNWIAVTNPQILDEFQTTANAFEKLSPRGEPGDEQACTTA